MQFKSAFITGGSGYIGRRVISKLIERGIRVKALARSEQAAAALQSLGAKPILGELLDAEILWEGMAGCDLVFHMAAAISPGEEDWRETERINVEGTRQVLTLAHEAGVRKIIYTSTIRVLGDTKGELVDETFAADGSQANQVERTRWLAHYDVALPLIEKGAPIVIVMPGEVYGPADPGPIGQLLEKFYFRQFPFPFLIAPNTVFTFAHVDDVAEGHLLAAEKGRIGESYILAGPAVSIGEMVDFWARLTGKRPPDFHVPARLARLVSPLVDEVGRAVDLPEPYLSALLGVAGSTYMASAEKAINELGWRLRPIQVGFLETFAALAADKAAHPLPLNRERELATMALGLAGLLFVVWVARRWLKP